MRRAWGAAALALAFAGATADAQMLGERKFLTLDGARQMGAAADRKSTRLNSSHVKRSRMPSSA